MKKFVIVLITLLLASQAFASGGEHIELDKRKWPFDGIFGKVDKVSAQRGFQVYKEVCAACHSLILVSYRDLEKLGFSAGEVKAIAAEKNVVDGPNDDGEMFERPALPSDKFVSPYNNKNAAKAANNGAFPPDLSLITKARGDGPNYVHSILIGYGEAPADVQVPEGLHYNKYFAGHKIAMPQPLNEGQISYQDAEVKSTVEQMSVDVVNFLQWAAEPEMDARKQMGIKVLLFLAVFTGFFYVAKKRIWARLD